MTETNKQLSAVFEQAFKAQADGVRDKCKCNGKGNNSGLSSDDYERAWGAWSWNGLTQSRDSARVECLWADCPSCHAERQRLLDRAKDFVWDNSVEEWPIRFHPTYTVESITETLEELNEWEGFVEWHADACYLPELIKVSRTGGGMVLVIESFDDDAPIIKREAFATILQKVKYYAQAVTSYLKQKGE